MSPAVVRREPTRSRSPPEAGPLGVSSKVMRSRARSRTAFCMHFVFDLLQAAGIAAAIGVRPLMPTLLAGGLAGADVGLDFDGTDYAFLEEPWFLAVVTVVVLALWVATRRARPEVLERGWAAYATAAIAGPLALLEGAGSMADGGHPAWVAMVVALACVSLGLAAAASLFARVRRR